jgi:FtsZ-binding cell division protein ZapB
MSREELRKSGPLEEDVDHVLLAAIDVEEIKEAAANWPDAQEIVDRAGDAESELDALREALNAWFERHPE